MARLDGAAANYVSLKYGGPVSERHGVESIGVTANNLFVNDPDRLTLIIINLSTNLIFLGPDQGVGSTNGIYIGANGGSMVLQVDEDLILPTIPWWLLAAGASSNVFWQTVRRFNSAEGIGVSNAT